MSCGQLFIEVDNSATVKPMLKCAPDAFFQHQIDNEFTVGGWIYKEIMATSVIITTRKGKVKLMSPMANRGLA